MPSVFDDPREPLALPTWDELARRRGEPVLSFRLGDDDIPVPMGLLPCCRVVHQPHCRSHVARSLVGCRFSYRLPDGTVVERAPLAQPFDGDVVARPRDLSGAVQASSLMATAMAEAEGGALLSMAFDVWTLDLETAEIHRYLSQEAERDAAADPDGDVSVLGDLPIEALDGASTVEIAALMAAPDWAHARSYARRVVVLPNEIGHDGRARYLSSAVCGEPGRLPPAVEAILRDPQEAT